MKKHPNHDEVRAKLEGRDVPPAMSLIMRVAEDNAEFMRLRNYFSQKHGFLRNANGTFDQLPHERTLIDRDIYNSALKAVKLENFVGTPTETPEDACTAIIQADAVNSRIMQNIGKLAPRVDRRR
jgi:hypothetical protein